MSGQHEAIRQADAQINHEDSVGLRLYGDRLVQAGPQQAVEIAEDSLSGMLGRSEHDHDFRTPVTLVMAAQAAGVLAEHGGREYGWRVVEASGQLSEDQTADLGQFVRSVDSVLTDPGATRQDVALQAIGMLNGYRAQRPELGDAADNLELAAAAYATGLCVGDRGAAFHMQAKLDQMIESRTEAEA